MVTIYQVAEKAEVSITTVSRVINHFSNVAPETREKVRLAIKALNWTPDSNARATASLDYQRNHNAQGMFRIA